ncbi:cell division protein FtsA [Persicitalea jodogahamensis]|uniref:Cell division protein FtsA n=1 Tax=Persicitalea jodogahamensis TaxID=402147 RepID=A0A8J3GA38_9BACT|nr:cell division protein FtsA [Persicitalea jodogahamensis]GHB71440.1 cell division protein FtsA [Persicitalea jodogahamensis]
MNKGIISVGLDIGSTKVAAVAVEAHDQDMIEIIGFSEVKVPEDAIVRGAVKNVKQVGMAIRSAISELAMRSDLDIRNVNVGFGGTNIQVSSITPNMVRPTSASSNEVTQTDVDQLIRDLYRAQTEPNNEVMHIIPGEFTVDNGKGVKEPVGRIGVRLGGQFLVVASNKQVIDATRNSLKWADPELIHEQLLLSPIAAGLAVLNDEEMAAGTALVDIGDHVTDIVIYHDGVVRHIVSIPIGGSQITSDLKIGCGIQKNNAESLKQQHGEGLSEPIPLNIEILVNYLRGREPKRVLKKNVALIIEERLKELAALVYAEILESGFADQLVGGLVLTGGTANLPDIETVFSRVAGGMPVKVGIPAGLANTPKADEVANTLYATAVGLAWAGIKRVDPRLDSICPTPAAPPKKPPVRDSRSYNSGEQNSNPDSGGLFPGWNLKNLFGGGDNKNDKTGGGY